MKSKIHVELILMILFSLAVLSTPVWSNNQLLEWFQKNQAFYQVATVIILVVVTTYYAWQTQRQADISRLMAEKMEQQRLDAVQPELVVCETSPNAGGAAIDFKEVLPVVSTIHLRETKIGIHNFGVGLARDVVSSVVVDGKASPDKELPPLAPEFRTSASMVDHWAWVESNRTHGDELGHVRFNALGPERVSLELRYRDTFGYHHMTKLQLRLDGSRKGEYLYHVDGVEYRHRYSGERQTVKEATS
ncbi:MAG: hypothetical protein Q8R28_22200, partial [Dehalococcoidia bacterium]|nr:hypothetical protein [Dehalococcoidia bacterium]